MATVRLKRPVITADTPIGKTPREWLEVEQHVSRPDGTDCWLWTGAQNTKGYPRSGKGNDIVHRLVAKIFWDFPDDYKITKSCGRKDCVNPKHLVITEHHRTGKKFPQTNRISTP